MFDRVSAIIPAGGCGELNGRGIPKVLEELPNGRSILGQVLTTVMAAGIKTTVVVVNNYKFQERIEAHLEAEGFTAHVTYALQHWRLGAAEAVAIGLEKLPDEIESVLVAYADMPLWREVTLRCLIGLHLETQAKVSMVTIRLDERTPESIRKFGRIVKDTTGRIIDIVEPQDEIAFNSALASSVNPSLYLFDREWLGRNLHRLEAYSKGDGFPNEFRLPPLVLYASRDGVGVRELHLNDPLEALGVNTPADLEEVSKVLRAEGVKRVH